MERLSGLILDTGQGVPGTGEQLFTPTISETTIEEVTGARVRSGWLVAVLEEALGLPSLAAVVIHDEMEENAFDKVTKATTLGIRLTTIAPKEAQREFLRELIGGLGFPKRPQQVAVDRAAIAPHQFFLGRGDGCRRTALCVAHDRPKSRNAAQMMVLALLFHVINSTAERVHDCTVCLESEKQKSPGHLCAESRRCHGIVVLLPYNVHASLNPTVADWLFFHSPSDIKQVRGKRLFHADLTRLNPKAEPRLARYMQLLVVDQWVCLVYSRSLQNSRSAWLGI